MFVDLHIHSSYSDGTMAPDEIITAAKENKVNIISITDHNRVDAYKEPLNVVSNDLNLIVGTELDCTFSNREWHVLGYGFDLSNGAMMNLINSIRREQQHMSELLVQRMEKRYKEVSYDEYLSYSYIRSRGGWKGINYILDKGLSSDQLDGLRYYKEFDIGPSMCNFPDFETVTSTIHRAGGYAILAHPGEYIDQEEDPSELFNSMKLTGIDGIECFYPIHSERFTAMCLEFCSKNAMYITAGSDCHGNFGNTNPIGSLNKSIQDINIPFIHQHRLF